MAPTDSNGNGSSDSTSDSTSTSESGKSSGADSESQASTDGDSSSDAAASPADSTAPSASPAGSVAKAGGSANSTKSETSESRSSSENEPSETHSDDLADPQEMSATAEATQGTKEAAAGKTDDPAALSFGEVLSQVVVSDPNRKGEVTTNEKGKVVASVSSTEAMPGAKATIVNRESDSSPTGGAKDFKVTDEDKDAGTKGKETLWRHLEGTPKRKE